MHGCWGCVHVCQVVCGCQGGVHGCWGGMHGFPGGRGWRGACMVVVGACVVDRGYAWIVGVHGCGGHAWLGACMVVGGMHG